MAILLSQLPWLVLLWVGALVPPWKKKTPVESQAVMTEHRETANQAMMTEHLGTVNQAMMTEHQVTVNQATVTERPPPPCPGCHQPMVVRYNGSDNHGFWGCVHYPTCRQTLTFVQAPPYEAACRHVRTTRVGSNGVQHRVVCRDCRAVLSVTRRA